MRRDSAIRKHRYQTDPIFRRRILDALKKRYDKDPEAARKRERANKARNPKRLMFRAKRSNAKIKGIPFSLEYPDIIWPDFCPVLGIKLCYVRGLESRKCGADDSPSFDRLNSTQGYTKENTIVVSWRANRLKSNASPDELRKLAAFYARVK